MNAVVHTEDLTISVPFRHLNWMSRLATSRKLSSEKNLGEGTAILFPFFLERAGYIWRRNKRRKKKSGVRLNGLKGFAKGNAQLSEDKKEVILTIIEEYTEAEKESVLANV